MITYNFPLSSKTWFRTGGCAYLYGEPTTSEEFQKLITKAREESIPISLLGEGANILVSDDGFPGMVIRPSLMSIAHRSEGLYAFVTAGAGVSCAVLIDYCLNNQLLGLEEFSGIPGTVGGALYINIHYFNFLLSDFLVSATVIEKFTGALTVVDKEWFNFGYNVSRLQGGNYYVLDATFQLCVADEYRIAYARGRSDEIIRHRRQRYPNERTCGSFFRNFHEHEVMVVSNGKKMIYIAYYLDKLGIKGALQRGKALVSHKHANMIVTQEGATSADVIELVRTMQQLVYDNFGILPHPECQFIGFTEYPLLK
jgi:UDP-N-acetylmuramate dehydrogenase